MATSKVDWGKYIPLQYPGAVTRSKLLRMKLIYAFVIFIGLGLSLFASGANIQAFGLGLMIPGGGFIQYMSGGLLPVMIYLSLATAGFVLFMAAMVLWFWNGNMIAPFGVWFLTAIGAASLNNDHQLSFAPAVVLSVVVLLVLLIQGKSTAKRQLRAVRLKQRQAAITEVHLPDVPLQAESGLRQAKELSEEDVRALSFAYDRALQPVDEWQGFYFGDQWQPAATRYQVNVPGWALALANHNSLPAMRGYLQQAQLNLIEKAQDHKMWSYWRWENLWGNLRWDADPMPIDNIMYSGYLGMQIGMYQAATGDLRHDKAGAIRLKHPNGDVYEYDFPKMNEIISHQFDTEFCLWPCEPNMVYPFCNIMGGVSLASYDVNHGTDYWQRLAPRFHKMWKEEFTYPDGSPIGLKSSRTGLGINLEETATQMVNGAFLSPLNPELSAIQWQIARSEIFQRREDGSKVIDPETLFGIDIGTYKKSNAYSLSNILMASSEQGDNEAQTHCRELMKDFLPTTTSGHVVYHNDVSVWVHAQLLMGRVGQAHGLHDLVLKGTDDKIVKGPLLTEVPYPEVLVAKAGSDGEVLDMVFYPGRGAGKFDIGLSQLKTGAPYVVELDGAEQKITASESGNADFNVEVRGRTSVVVRPLN